jgi:hypothetical protein
VALEEGLLIPDGSTAAMDEEKEALVAKRIDRIMALVSPEAKRLLVLAIYLTGDEALAEMFGVAAHEPSEAGTEH